FPRKFWDVLQENLIKRGPSPNTIVTLATVLASPRRSTARRREGSACLVSSAPRTVQMSVREAVEHRHVLAQARIFERLDDGRGHVARAHPGRQEAYAQRAYRKVR